MRWMVRWRPTELNQHIPKYVKVVLKYFLLAFLNGISEETLSSSNLNFPYSKSLLKYGTTVSITLYICHKVDFYRTTPNAGRKFVKYRYIWKMLLEAFWKKLKCHGPL